MISDEIIEGCIREDRLCQQQLFNHYAGKMLSLCIRYCGNRASAEDVLQDGFIRVFDNLSSFRKEGSFDGWIRRIFVNTALTSLRKSWLKFENTPLETVHYEPEDNSLTDKYSVQNIHSHIAEMPPGYRTIFNLFAVEGYSHSEIAAMVGIAESTSRSQFFKARQMLRQKLNSQEVTYP